MKRYASNRVFTEQGVLYRAVVEIDEGVVMDCYEFTDELPFTEWLGDDIILRRDDRGLLRAFWHDYDEEVMLE